MRFAYLIMGEFDSSVDCAVIHNGVSRIVGVSDIEDAKKKQKICFMRELTA